MRNLLPYTGDTFSLYEEAIANKNSGHDKTLLTNSKELIKDFYNEYDLHFASNTLNLIPGRRVNGSLHKALSDLYSYNSKVVRKIRSTLIEINPKTVNGVCQHCGFNSSDTMDHILPRSNNSEYSVNARNLIPSCTDCNRRKNASDILNLYTDILPQVEYLFMDVLADGDTIDFVFRLDNTSGLVDATLFDRITRHYSKLDLFDRMKIKAQSEFKGFIISINQWYNFAGKEQVINSVMDSLTKLRDAYGFNYWQVAFYKGLVNSTVFWDYYENGLLE